MLSQYGDFSNSVLESKKAAELKCSATLLFILIVMLCCSTIYIKGTNQFCNCLAG